LKRKRGHGDSNLLPNSRSAFKQPRALPSEGEPGAPAGAQCGGVDEVEEWLRERVRARGARGLFIWHGGLGDRQEWSWRPGRLLAGRGGGVGRLGCGVRGAGDLEGCVRLGVSRQSCRPFGWDSTAQVFDGGLGGLTSEIRRGAAPVGSWGGAEFESMVKIDRR
jgi:hypothetical protein